MRLENIIEKAKQVQGFKSDAALCDALGLGRTAISQMRSGRAWPSDKVMIRLASMAGEDVDTALLYLNAWRTEGETSQAYMRLAAKLTAATIAALVFIVTLAAPSPSKAERPIFPTSMYIMENILGRFRALINRAISSLYPRHATV